MSIKFHSRSSVWGHLHANAEVPKRVSRSGTLSMLAAAGILGLPLSASAQVEQQFLELQDALAPPAIQAAIVACIGEPMVFTGTVHVMLVDGNPTHFNWQGVTGVTPDGDFFVGGSGVNVGQQSNVTLAEVGAGRDSRQFHLQIVNGDVLVVCH